MPYTIEKLPDAPVVIFVHETKQFSTEMDPAIHDIVAVLDAQSEPVFLIMDIRQVSWGMDDVTIGANAVTRRPEAMLHHPNMREVLFISTLGLIKLAAQGLRSAAFGGVNVRVFDTTEQALDYCRERIAVEAGGA